MKEDFQYDNLDRLDNVYMGGNMTLDMAYNKLIIIFSKSPPDKVSKSKMKYLARQGL
ncbi:MAG TPA: hypothetical protein PLX00_08640 [Bacteroidales bacterium]|nr:hypothetical protein [Bacteroidales bacterium]